MDRTARQKQAICLVGKNACVRAGAGSGKTLVLVERIIHLLETGNADLDEIVAITFTDKAAAEMKARLRSACRERARESDQDGTRTWRKLERRIDTARISTIHSFCASLLREHALELGLDPDFSMMTDTERTLLRKQIVRATVHGMLDSGDESTVRLAVEHGVFQIQQSLESALRQATLMGRIARWNPFENANELQKQWERVALEEHERRLSELPRSRAFKKTRAALVGFYGMCTKPEDGREVLRIALLELCDLIAKSSDTGEIGRTLADMLTLWPLKHVSRRKHWPSPEVFDRLSDVESAMKDLATRYKPPVFDANTESKAAELASAFYKVYQKTAQRSTEAKQARAALEFEDLIQLTANALGSDIDLRRRVSSGIKYLLIDEFQDTDAVQLELARHLMEEGAELFVVGDSKQSIYDFRGAEVEVFQEAENLTDTLIPLDRNFRSLPEILHFVNDFFAGSGLLEKVEPEYHLLEAHRDGTGEAQVEFLLPEEAAGTTSDGYRRMEGELIADRLAEMCATQQGVQVFDKESETLRPADFGDAAILFRSSTGMNIYEDALRRRRVPFQVVEGRGFYERQEVSDFQNLLKSVIDPWDEMALLGFLRSPMAALSDDTIALLCRAQGLAEALRIGVEVSDPEQNERLAGVRSVLSDFRLRTEMPLAAFLRHVLSVTGYEAILLTQQHGVQKATNLGKLVELAEVFSTSKRPTLGAFVRYLDEVSTHEIREGDAPLHSSESGAVTLMTVHKAKGLEFPILVVADTARGVRASRRAGHILQHRRLGMAAQVYGTDGKWLSPAIGEAIIEAEKEQRQAEEARILYVALTRARDWLLIGGAPPTRKNDSWFEAINEHFQLNDKEHGDRLEGKGWGATVRRRPGESKAAAVEKAAEPVVSMDVLLRRAEPVSEAVGEVESISVSEMLDAPQEDRAPDERPSHPGEPGGRDDALVRGTLAHSLFEHWLVERGEDPPIERVLKTHCPAPRMRREYEDYLNSVSERFKNSKTYTRLQSETCIQREIPFSLRINGRYVNGVIDAVLSDGTIIDYKTGRPDPKAQSRYEAQLKIYAAALRGLTDFVEPKAMLYYVDSGEEQVVNVASGDVDELLETLSASIA